VSRPLPNLVAARVVVRLATRDDAAAIVRFYRDNDDFIGRTQNRATPEHLDETAIVEALTFRLDDYRADRSCRMFAFAPGGGEVIGAVNLSNFVRGYFQACHLGYAIAEKHARQGIMSEAVALALGFAFASGGLGLHRVMANYTPENLASGRLLSRLGFRVEGYAPRYLRIHGKWRDHVLSALTAEEHEMRKLGASRA
jgi:ribosomal-protein-alanine N-acetyltransferase